MENEDSEVKIPVVSTPTVNFKPASPPTTQQFENHHTPCSAWTIYFERSPCRAGGPQFRSSGIRIQLIAVRFNWMDAITLLQPVMITTTSLLGTGLRQTLRSTLRQSDAATWADGPFEKVLD